MNSISLLYSRAESSLNIIDWL